MKYLSKLTAKDFSVAMHKGWRGRKWTSRVNISEDGKSCCAYGAMSIALGVSTDDLWKELFDRRDFDINTASDNAGNKRAAMKAVDQVLLSTGGK